MALTATTASCMESRRAASSRCLSSRAWKDCSRRLAVASRARATSPISSLPSCSMRAVKSPEAMRPEKSTMRRRRPAMRCASRAEARMASTREMRDAVKRSRRRMCSAAACCTGPREATRASSWREWATMLRKEKSRTAVAMHSTKTKESRSLEKTLPVTVKSSVQRSAYSVQPRCRFAGIRPIAAAIEKTPLSADRRRKDRKCRGGAR